MSLKVLIQNRSSALSMPGGDTVVMNRTIEELSKLGVNVTLDLDGQANLTNFDIVHIFNFATPQITEEFARRAHAAGKPYVVTTLSEDAPNYRNQAMEWARFLIDYVTSGQNKNWFEHNKPKWESIPKASRFQNDWVANHASALITNGPAESSVICRDYGNLPIHEVYLGFDRLPSVNADAFIKSYGVKDFVLSVGRLEFRKNQLALLKALEDSDITLVLAAGGFSYDEGYANACRQFKRAGKTIVTDRLSPEMLASAFKAARVHALPSWYELPGLVSLEAAFYGANLVVSDCGTTRDYLGNAAFYCNPGDIQSIKKAVDQAFSGVQTSQLIERINKFTWQSMAEQTLSIYQKVLDKNKFNSKQEEVVDNKIKFAEQEHSNRPATFLGGYDMAGGITEFQELLERGELAAKERQYNIAHELLARAEQLNSTSARVARARGAVYLAENMIPAAQRCFEKALLLDDNDPKAYSGLGMCYMQQKHTDSAYQCFVKSLSIDNTSLVTMLQLLECSYVLSRFDDLINVLEDYLHSNPNDKDMQYCLAGAYYKQQNFEKAEQICVDVIAALPEHKGALELRQAIASSRSANEQSYKLQQVASADATATINMTHEHLLANLEEQKHKRNYSDVLTKCNQALSDRTLEAKYRERIEVIQAEVLLLSGKLAEGAQIFKNILELNPKCSRALCGQGALAATASQWREAKQLFTKAFEIDARSDVALAGLAMCAASENNTEQAWNLYSQSVAINPENMRALLGLMEIGYPLKRFVQVEQALRNYLDLHPADAQFMYSLSGCLYAQNKIDQAVAELSRLTLLDPQHAGAQELINIIAQRESGAVGV